MKQTENTDEREQQELTRIRISVRNLVEFIFRSGDIDNRIGKGVQKEAMQEGSRMHRKIQGRMGIEYRAEVPLALSEILRNLGCNSILFDGKSDCTNFQKSRIQTNQPEYRRTEIYPIKL